MKRKILVTLDPHRFQDIPIVLPLNTKLPDEEGYGVEDEDAIMTAISKYVYETTFDSAVFMYDTVED